MDEWMISVILNKMGLIRYIPYHKQTKLNNFKKTTSSFAFQGVPILGLFFFLLMIYENTTHVY